MNGIDNFKGWFSGFTKEYVIIGGAACDILAANVGLEARATKDIDMVLLMENMTREFAQRFWEYIRAMGYENRQKGDGSQQFYRFTHPSDPSAPYMIELFAHHFEDFPLPEDAVITPIPLEDPLSDLSGILVDEPYYQFLASGGVEVDGVIVLDELHLIPLKAKAWLNLMAEKERDVIPVRRKDLRKHPADVAFLASMLREDAQIQLSPTLHRDLELFLDQVASSEYGQDYRDGTVAQQLRQVYPAPEPQVV